MDKMDIELFMLFYSAMNGYTRIRRQKVGGGDLTCCFKMSLDIIDVWYV